MGAFLNRPIEGDWPYLWIDATYVKVREAGRIVSVAVIIAVAVNTDGQREVLGMSVGASEAEPFWTSFLRSLTRRGLRGVKLVIADAHEGLKVAVSKVLKATAQRCRVHFMRNALAHVPKGQRQMVAPVHADPRTGQNPCESPGRAGVYLDELQCPTRELVKIPFVDIERDKVVFVSVQHPHRVTPARYPAQLLARE